MILWILSALFVAVIGDPDEWITGTFVTGYWDCCKPSCSWPGKGSVHHPVAACHKETGLKLMRADANAKSVCDGGVSATCSDNIPFSVSMGVSMGFAAAAVGGIHGLVGDGNCGQCYELRFTDEQHTSDDGYPWGGSHPALVNKSHIVQVTNIGYDVSGNHSFDLMIPGAGQGLFTSGCAAQFPGYSIGAFDCSNLYGGCSDKSGCAELPPVLRSGCEWRYDWFKWLVRGGKVSNNPWVKFRRVRCPIQLTKISGSTPVDDEDYPSIEADDIEKTLVYDPDIPDDVGGFVLGFGVVALAMLCLCCFAIKRLRKPAQPPQQPHED